MGQPKLMKGIAAKILHRVTSLGLNEQELFFLARVEQAPFHDRVQDPVSVPPVWLVSDLVHWILQTFGKAGNPHSRLTRVHFHCLTFHLVAVLDGEVVRVVMKAKVLETILGTISNPGFWASPEASVAAGSLTCSQRACNHAEPTSDNYELRFVSFLATQQRDAPR